MAAGAVQRIDNVRCTSDPGKLWCHSARIRRNNALLCINFLCVVRDVIGRTTLLTPWVNLTKKTAQSSVVVVIINVGAKWEKKTF